MSAESKAPFDWELNPARDQISIRLGAVEMKLSAEQLQMVGLWMLELRSRMEPTLPVVPNETTRPLPATGLYVSQYRGRVPTEKGCNILLHSASVGFFNFPAPPQACQQIVRDLTTIMPI